MALTPEQRQKIIAAAIDAHKKGKPLFPPKAKAKAAPKTDDDLLKMEWADLTPQQQGRVMALLQDRIRPKAVDLVPDPLSVTSAALAESAEAKPAWLVKGWLELTEAERAEFRAMKWEDFKADEERVQAMFLQQQRLTPPKL